MRQSSSHISIAHRQRIDITSAKIRSDCSHEIGGVGAAEASVYPLPLLQRMIDNRNAAHQRLAATGGKGAKIDHDGRHRRHGRTFELYRAHRQRARYAAKRIVDEKTANVILSE